VLKLKKIKDKTCRCCRVKFVPIRPLQVVCSPACAYGLVLKNNAKKAKEESKQWNKEVRERRDELKTKSDYEKDLEREINHIVRLLDKGHPCISSGRVRYIVNAGHYYSVGSNPAIRYNLYNIFGQSVGDNMYKGGTPREYEEGLRETFGEGFTEEVKGLKLKYKELHLSVHELKEKIKIARKCVRILKEETRDNEKPFTTLDRMSLRGFYNSIIGIYK
jgi:hypothetical protein